MIYGYARVSTLGQGRDGNSLEEQVNALKEYGCQEIVTEAFSAKTMERPKFQELLSKLEKTDTLAVTKLDRFARTTIEGVQTVQELFMQANNVTLQASAPAVIKNVETSILKMERSTHMAECRQQVSVELVIAVAAISR